MHADACRHLHAQADINNLEGKTRNYYYLPYFSNVSGMVFIGMADKTDPKVALFLHIGMGMLPHVALFTGWDRI